MSLSLRAVLPGASPMAALAALPVCASPFCPRPPSLWQRWWARHEGVWIHQHWYCSLDCFQVGLFRRLEQAALAGPRSARRANRLPLGLILLSQGDITGEQLREALSRQAAAKRGRIGEWLVEMGAVTETQVTAALAAQQGCPLFPLPEPQRLPERMYWPELLVHRYGAAPVFHDPAQPSLYVGFLERVDHGFLLSLEQMLRCRTRPCILTPSAYRRQLELRAFLQPSESIMIHQPQSGMEMTRTISNYAEQVHAERCSIARCDDRLWTRLESSGDRHVDFLFRLPMMG
ncbi:MAG TPA: hypothetical protein VKV05_05455 [Terriglobales bacterium]|nr:hypothetical protein [Terriglobales bacterium]